MDWKSVEGRTFAEETVELDGVEFVGCTFKGCTLIYRGGQPFIFGEGTNFDKRCNIQFEDAAANTLNTLRGMYRFGGDAMVETMIASIRNPFGDGIQ